MVHMFFKRNRRSLGLLCRPRIRSGLDDFYFTFTVETRLRYALKKSSCQPDVWSIMIIHSFSEQRVHSEAVFLDNFA